MAPPAKVNAPPQTLPADFFDKQGSPPETLPADFDFGTGQGDTPKPPPTDARNRFQKAFDAATQTKPIGSEPGVSGLLDTTLGNVGGGVLSLAAPLFHPEQTAKTLLNTASGMFSSGPGWGEPVKLFSDAPSMQESLIQGAKAAKKQPSESGKQYAARIGGDAFAAVPQVAAAMTAPEVLEGTTRLIPSANRAGRLLEEIRTAAKEVPVSLTKTQPELNRFEELTQAGGRRSKPFTQLYKRAQDEAAPIKFPEARDFYTNIGDATNQTTLQKLMGRGMKPNMRRAGLMAKHALNEDLTNAASSIGRGEDYTNAMHEYANAMKLRRVLRTGGLLAAGEAARRTGLLGNWIHRTALQQ